MTTSVKQKPSVAVRLSDALELYLRDRAAEAHRTLTGEIRMRLEASREADQQPKQRTAAVVKKHSATSLIEDDLQPHPQ